MEIEVTINDHERALNISGDMQRIHKKSDPAAFKMLNKEDEAVMQGVHLLSLIEARDSPIKDHYPLKIEEFEFKLPVGINDKTVLNYEFTQLKPLKQGRPFFLYKLEIKKDNLSIAEGKIYTTDNYGAFMDVATRASDEVYTFNPQKEMPKIGDIKMPDFRDEYAALLGITSKQYSDKYGDMDSGLLSSARKIAHLVNSIGDIKTKTYVFKRYADEIYGKGSKGDLQIFADKKEKRGISFLEILIKDFGERIVSRSNAAAVGYAF